METGITLRDKIQFRWPKAGNTSFQLTILSDSYIGCSVKKDVEVTIHFFFFFFFFFC